MFNRSTFKSVPAGTATNMLNAYSKKCDESRKVRNAAIDAANAKYASEVNEYGKEYLDKLVQYILESIEIGLADIYPDILTKVKCHTELHDTYTRVYVSFDDLGHQYRNLWLEYETTGYRYTTLQALWHISINGVRMASEHLRYSIFKALREEMEFRDKNTGSLEPTETYHEFEKVRDKFLTEACADIQRMLDDYFHDDGLVAYIDDTLADLCVHIKCGDHKLPVKYSLLNRWWYWSDRLASFTDIMLAIKYSRND